MKEDILKTFQDFLSVAKEFHKPLKPIIQGILGFIKEPSEEVFCFASEQIEFIKANRETLESEFCQLCEDYDIRVTLPKLVMCRHNGAAVFLDSNVTPKLKQEGLIRDLIRAIQEYRKELGLNLKETVRFYFNQETEELFRAIVDLNSLLCSGVNALTFEKADSLTIGKQINVDKKNSLLVYCEKNEAR